MDTDRDIQRAIDSGTRNKEAMELIHNWCRHARVEKFGGTGLIEMETGLPIGHHSMACDHASAGGFACWDIGEAALHFYDRNCVECIHRVPVRLPNITGLLQKRGAYRKREEDERREIKNRTTAQREIRQNARQALRCQLNPVSATIVDVLEELDQDTEGKAHEKLIGMAQLAPETFTPTVVEYCFSMLENRETWFDKTGLQILDKLTLDQARLTRCALLSLAEHHSVEVAAKIIEENNKLIDESLVANALPALILHANPDSTPFMIERKLVPEPLVAVHRAHRVATETGIGRLLDERDPYLIDLAVRAIQVLAREDQSIAYRFSRSLVAKLAYAHLVIDYRDTWYAGEDHAIHDLQITLALALEYNPVDTDALIAKFMANASSEGEKRLYKIYSNLLHSYSYGENNQLASRAAIKVAFKRILNAVSTLTNEDVLRELQSAFSYLSDDDLLSVAKDELTGILGTAILLDSRIHNFDAELVPNNNFLSHLERQNYRNVLLDLQNSLVKLAATSASDSELAIQEYIEILGQIPEGQDQLRSVMIKNAHRLMESPSGLNAVLPALYTAMFGSSSLVRASAARVVGKLNRRGREDVPDLLYEGFTALLFDSYVIVHKAAVDALENLELPKNFDLLAKLAIAAWIENYSISKTDDRFLIKSIQLYLRRYATEQQRRDHLGRFFVTLLNKIDINAVAENIQRFQYYLRETDGFADLVLKTMTNSNMMQYRIAPAPPHCHIDE